MANSYINRCRSLCDQIAKLGSSIFEEIFVNIMLQGLGPKWWLCKALLRQQGVISEAALCAALLVERRDMDQQRPAPQQDRERLAFYADNIEERRPRRLYYKICINFGHLAHRCKFRSRPCQTNPSHWSGRQDPQNNTRAAGAGGAAGASAGAAGAGAAGGAAGAGGATGASGGAAGTGAAGGAAGASGGAAGAGVAGGATGAGGAAGAGAAGGAAGVGAAGGGAGAAGAAGASPLPGPSPYSGPTRGLTERREPESRPVSPESRSASPVCPVRAGRVSRPRPPPVPGTHSMTLRPSTAPQHVPLPSPPASSLPAGPDPASDSLRAASPAVMRFFTTAVTDPLFESTAASALVTKLVEFAAACRLDYTASLVTESVSVCVCPPSVGGECDLGTDVLEDRQEEFECFAASVPHLMSLLLAPEGDPDAPDIPTPRSYAEAIEGLYSSQWQAAMDAEMASWKSTGTYVDEVPPPGVNIVSGMGIFSVKRPPGSPPVFKARYVARGFSQRQGVDFFQTFSPTPKMTTLRVLLHVAAQCDYELHSFDFSTAFLQGRLHEEIRLRRPPGFTGSFPPGTQWSLRRPVYGLRQAPREWHNTIRTTLAALGFAPSTSDPSLFLRTNTTLPPFYVLVYVDDLVFATADSEALAHVKSELQKRQTCTDLGELTSYLGLRITRDRAQRTITLTQSNMVQQVLQCFGFTYSSPQSTPLPTGHSLSAPPSDESVEPSGPYPELVGCLIGSRHPRVRSPSPEPARHRIGAFSNNNPFSQSRCLKVPCIAIAGRGLAAIAKAEREAWLEEGRSNLEFKIATRGIFGTEEHPLPGPSSQHLQGKLRGTGVGTFNVHNVPRPYTKEKFLEIYSHQRDSTKKLTVAQEEELARREADELRQWSLAESRDTFAWSGWEEEESASNEGGWRQDKRLGSFPQGPKEGRRKEEAEPPVVPLGRPPHRPAPALPPPDIQPHRDPWDTIDWGNEPSTSRHIVYGPDLKPREPTFVPGTILVTNIPFSVILDREFLALMLTAANEEEAEEAAAEPAQAPDEDPVEAHVRYMRTSGFRASDDLWHQRLGHPSCVTLKNCIEAGVFAPGALLCPDGTKVRRTTQLRNCTVCPKAALSHQPFPLLEPGTNRYPKLHKAYSDFLNVGHCGINDELYTLTFVDAGTRYVWIVNVEVCSREYEVFRLWPAHAQRQSGEKLKF
ncbi:unnamed protein product [Closterium sp. NIES-54]